MGKGVVEMLFLLLLTSPLVQGTSPYVPGTPGAPWTDRELLTVKAKLFRLFRYGISAPAVLRLGFHDCLKYKDGTGGCDGCLNWHGMGHRFGEDMAETRREENLDEGNNNGLEGVVKILEQVYTDKDQPGASPSLDVSLRDSGKSRADFWAFAAMMAVEFGKDTTNIACIEGDSSERIPSGSLCLHNFGEPTCSVEMPRPFKFQTGRADCVERDPVLPYKTEKAEVHPNPVGNGQSTIEFFRNSFGMTGREVVALMGAHTFGQPHFQISMFPYTWTSKQTNLWTNDYYKMITDRPRWFFSPEPGDACNKVGDPWGNIPETRWLAHTRKCTKRGGPIFWIHENYACPDCNLASIREGAEGYCCKDVPEGQFCNADRAGPNEPDTSEHNWSPHNEGCEKFRLISGADEIALNAEMGLYREFEVTDGVIHGCPGLEVFNETMTNPDNPRYYLGQMSLGEDNWNGAPRCEKQRLEEPPGSGDPLHLIFEEYADDQSAWMRDYVPAMEKMAANGYENSLVDAPDFTTGVVCPFPLGPPGNTVWSCYRPEAAGSGPAYVIRADMWGFFWLPDDVRTGTVLQAGVDKEELWSFTGSDEQLWKWSESGNQLINVATGKPLAVGGFTEWRVTNSSEWPYAPMLETQYGGQVLDAGGQPDGCGGHIGTYHYGGHGSQWFSLHLADQFEGNPDYDCPPTTAAPTTTGAPTTARPAKAPTTPPPTPPTTPPPTTAQQTTVGSVDECTEDGSNVLADEILVENLFDLTVMADNGSGKLVLKRRDTSSSLQRWQVAPLCNGKFKVINVGTGIPASFGPWTYDSENKLLQSDDGLWAWNKKRKRLRLDAKVKYLKGTTTPWKRFQWNIVQV